MLAPLSYAQDPAPVQAAVEEIAPQQVIAPEAATPPPAAPPVVIEPEERVMDDFPVVRLRSLDKVTARTVTFEASVGSTVKFGPLYVKIQACREAPPIEQPESAAFLQIWEVTPEEESKWIFSGWMFASSPGLSPMDHPIYDVWVLDCLEKKGEEKKTPTAQDTAADEVKEGEGEIKASDAPAAPDATMNAAPEEEIPVEDIGQ
jgi:hypothetical protein